jgi:SAM-dependent methyltransferase
MSDSVSFDRAAEYYDRTRSLSPEASGATTALLMRELAGSSCLEIGVGTGRISVPLQEAGLQVTGTDLSLPMIEVLRHKGGGEAPFPVTLGDATRLPFGDDSFGGGIVCHVFHLIPAWQDAADELIRVIEPGGRICLEVGNWGHDGWLAIQEHLATEAGIPRRFPGVNSPEEVDAEFEARGATVRILDVVLDTKSFTYLELIESFASGQWSWTWAADADTLKAAGERTKVWAAVELGDLNDTIEHQLESSWRTYDLP